MEHGVVERDEVVRTAEHDVHRIYIRAAEFVDRNQGATTDAFYPLSVPFQKAVSLGKTRIKKLLTSFMIGLINRVNANTERGELREDVD
ncbi:hypothetical protein PoHVEF18_004739 [Penicillium ochrochloron]